MDMFDPQQTTMAEWHALVEDAVNQCGYTLDDSVRQYLTLTLDHFTKDGQLAAVVLALDFLAGVEAFGRQGNLILRQVGDRCLLLAGLFPERAQRKRVGTDYFVDMGRQAYQTIADVPIQTAYDSTLFASLSYNFARLTNILQAMRHLDIYAKPKN